MNLYFVYLSKQADQMQQYHVKLDVEDLSSRKYNRKTNCCLISVVGNVVWLLKDGPFMQY